MTNLYSQLYRYQQRETRSPLEDFLTEAIADLLSRAPANVVREFIDELMLPGPARSAWRLFSASLDTYEIVTQKYTTDRKGRMDLLFLTDKKPLLIVECKISGKIREYEGNADRDSVADEQGRSLENQLTRYSQWLAAQRRPSGWNGAITLLSHYVRPPKGFLAGDDSRYCDLWRHSASWAQVFRWFRACGQDNLNEKGRTWRDLAAELTSFLAEEDLASEQITSHDLAAAEMFVGSQTRFDQLFKVAFSEIESQLKDVCADRHGDWKPDSAGKLCWDWRYLAPRYQTGNSRWYISWGIRWPGESALWIEPPDALPHETHVFVNLGTEGEAVPVRQIPKSELPPGWSCVRSEGEADAMELVVGRPLFELAREPDHLAERFGSWVSDRIKEIKPLLPKLKNHAQA